MIKEERIGRFSFIRLFFFFNAASLLNSRQYKRCGEALHYSSLARVKWLVNDVAGERSSGAVISLGVDGRGLGRGHGGERLEERHVDGWGGMREPRLSRAGDGCFESA